MTDSPAAAHLDAARAFLARVPLFDGHNDLPYIIRSDRMAQGDVAAFALGERRPQHGRDTDIPRLREGGVGAQFWAAFVPPNETHPCSYALQQIALIRRMNQLHADTFLDARSAADVTRAHAEGKIASFIAIENGAALEGRLDTLDAFHALGVRLMTLCHNNTTDWCDSATDAPAHNGLSDFGKRVIARMNALGMIVDLAHVSTAVMHQVLDMTRAPVVWSHSNAKALCDHPRNVPDDVLDRVAVNGGVVMATFVPDFISQRSRDWMKPLKDHYGRSKAVYEADLLAAQERAHGPWPRGTRAQYCDHLDYLKSRVGAAHIGIGSDFFGGPQGAGLEDASCFPGIVAELMARQWSEAELTALVSGNVLRVFEAVEKAAE